MSAHAAYPGVLRQVSLAEARAASNRPGADTEGTLPDTARSLARAYETDATTCWYASPTDTWGTWPYNQSVTQNTYWCRKNGLLSYRSTTITTGSYFCSSHDPYEFKVAGGVGYTYVVVHRGAYFNCPTAIPWININVNDWAEWGYDVFPLWWEVQRD